MQFRAHCAAVAAWSACSIAFSAYAGTSGPIPAPNVLDVASQDAPAIDAEGGSATWARLSLADFSRDNSAAGIPACGNANSPSIGEDSRQRAAHLQFRDPLTASTDYPQYPSRPQLVGSTSANANPLAADAVNANFSNLGANLAPRGRYCTTQFGSTRVTAAVGKFADDWALLANGQPPAQTRDAAAAVRYANKSWQTGLGFTQGTFDNARASGNGTSAGLNYDFAIVWNDVMASVPPSWNARFTFGTAYQRQDFDTGSIAHNTNANVGIAVQHQQWGMFSAAIARGHSAQLAGAYADSQTYQSEFSRPLSRKHSVKFYYRQTRTVNYNDTTASDIRDQSGGL
jgi:hypothetical protein